jgi:hypothetical protein
MAPYGTSVSKTFAPIGAVELMIGKLANGNKKYTTVATMPAYFDFWKRA